MYQTRSPIASTVGVQQLRTRKDVVQPDNVYERILAPRSSHAEPPNLTADTSISSDD